MWCDQCQADVQSLDDFSNPGAEICAHCGTVLKLGEPHSVVRASRYLPPPKTLVFDDLWTVDLDAAKAKRLTQAFRKKGPGWGRSLSLESRSEDSASIQVSPATIGSRSRNQREQERQERFVFIELFILAVALFVGFGLLTGHRAVIESGLAVGAVAVVMCVILWISQPIRSITKEKYQREDSPFPVKRAA